MKENRKQEAGKQILAFNLLLDVNLSLKCTNVDVLIENLNYFWFNFNFFPIRLF